MEQNKAVEELLRRPPSAAVWIGGVVAVLGMLLIGAAVWSEWGLADSLNTVEYVGTLVAGGTAGTAGAAAAAWASLQRDLIAIRGARPHSTPESTPDGAPRPPADDTASPSVLAPRPREYH